MSDCLDFLKKDNECKNIIIACTGSVATIKLKQLINTLFQECSENKIQIKVAVVATQHAKHFFNADDLPLSVKLFVDEDEWQNWKGRGDPVLHIELAKWADGMVIAPLDANTLGKMSQGICDNLLTCVTRAWIMSKPLLFCPAMNTRMWEHPITSKQIDVLKNWGHIEVPCVNKVLMCGDTGMGAMAEVDAIIKYIKIFICKNK